MLIRRAPRFTASEITDPKLYLSRRELMAGAAALALVPGGGEAAAPKGEPLAAKRNPAFSLSEAATKIDHATTYNNFYEFGVNKDDPSRLAHTLRPRPWSVQVDGLVHKPKTFDIDELIKLFPLEERVYSLRCVEAWSMVVPWIGFPLAPLQACRAGRPGEVRRVHDAPRLQSVPGPEARVLRLLVARLAVRRGASPGRGAAPADAAHRGHVRPGAAESKRRARARRGAVEVRVQ